MKSLLYISILLITACNLSAQQVIKGTVTDAGNGHKVTVAFDESVFSNGVLWQQDAESFVCMEPGNGGANSVNEEGRHIELAPGETKEFKWSVTIE